MATTVTFSNPSFCSGGGHLHITAQVNGGASFDLALDVAAVLTPLNADEANRIGLDLLRLHFRGKTKAQAAAEFQAGGGQVSLVI